MVESLRTGERVEKEKIERQGLYLDWRRENIVTENVPTRVKNQ